MLTRQDIDTIAAERINPFDLWAKIPPNPVVEQPTHYLQHPSGVECIRITEHMTFNLGNAMKYIWRSGRKDDVIVDLEKAIWYLKREVGRIQSNRESQNAKSTTQF